MRHASQVALIEQTACTTEGSLMSLQGMVGAAVVAVVSALNIWINADAEHLG